MNTAPVRPLHVTNTLDPGLIGFAELVLCDLDGCLISGNRPYENAAEFVAGCADRLWIVSNNSTHTATGMSRDLHQLGLTIPPHRILLAGEQALWHLSTEHPGATLALFGGAGLRSVAQGLGFDLGATNPDIALLCRDFEFSIDRLNALAALLSQGTQLWVANTDASHPGHNGLPIAETGALLAAVRAMLPGLGYRSVGKPHRFMADKALHATNVAPQNAVFVGDNADTDGGIAIATGIPFVHLQRQGAAT